MVTAAGACFDFCTTSWLGTFLLLPGWEACQSQPLPPALLYLLLFIYSPGWREALWKLSAFLLKNKTQWTLPEFESRALHPEASMATKITFTFLHIPMKNLDIQRIVNVRPNGLLSHCTLKRCDVCLENGFCWPLVPEENLLKHRYGIWLWRGPNAICFRLRTEKNKQQKN